MTGTAGSALTEALGDRCSWWATTCSSPTPRGWPKGIEKGCANSMLVKVNQIGTLTETLPPSTWPTARG
jgi:enolase